MIAPVTFSAAVLAGGESRRMGRSKAWLELGGQPLLARAVSLARAAGASEVLISGRMGEDYAALGCPVLFDLEPGLGPVGGIERALHAAAFPQVLMLAVDLPRMTPEFLRRLASACDETTGVVPTLEGDLEPLAAIYPVCCHEIATGHIRSGRLSARDFAEACLEAGAVRSGEVAASESICFANLNHPRDLLRFQ